MRLIRDNSHCYMQSEIHFALKNPIRLNETKSFYLFFIHEFAPLRIYYYFPQVHYKRIALFQQAFAITIFPTFPYLSSPSASSSSSFCSPLQRHLYFVFFISRSLLSRAVVPAFNCMMSGTRCIFRINLAMFRSRRKMRGYIVR